MVTSFDTNVPIDAVDREGGLHRQQAAALLERAMRSGNCLQTLQSLSEFYNMPTRKTRIAAERADAFVTAWRSVSRLKRRASPISTMQCGRFASTNCRFGMRCFGQPCGEPASPCWSARIFRTEG